MNNEKPYSSFALVKSLFGFVRPYKGRFITATIARIISDLAWLYPAYALAAITTFFSGYVPGESLAGFWRIVTLLGLALLIHIISGFTAHILGYRAAKRAGLDAELSTMKHAFALDIDWHEKENTGNKVKRIGRGADGVNHLLRMWLSSFIEISVSIFGIFFIISRFDKKIALWTFGFLVVYLSVSIFLTKKAVKIQRAEQVKEEELSGLVFESINNVRSAKVMSMIKPLYAMISKICDNLYMLARKRIFWYQSGGLARNFTGQIFRVAMISYIGFGIMQGRYELGFLVLFYSYFSNVLHSASRLADISQDFVARKQAVGRMMELLEVKPVTDVEEGKVPFPKDWKKIEIKEVSFSYGDKEVLDKISFTISRGDKIGVVGLSGAGKSTLFKLLLKERETYEGEILVDGTPLRMISKVDYFKHTAVVLQETEVFNLSLRDNVTISSFERAGDEKLLKKALNVAHVEEFARALPSGIETLIGEKGVKLSGGEKQRVGLARAVFKNPELLLLDEATSHLDVESEEKIQDSLHQFFQTVTAIVIAHRLTTIKQMDKILVIEGGKIIEQGSFSEIYGKKGRFYELWEKQKL